MVNKYITMNKHEFNVRRVEELNSDILAKEKELETVKGFFNTLRVKSQLSRLYRLINIHGSEVLEFEYRQATNNY